MAYRIDNASYSVTVVKDGLVKIGWDFTTDTESDDWQCEWLHASILWNLNRSTSEFGTEATIAMAAVVSSDDTTDTVLTYLQNHYGETVQRTDPNAVAEPAPGETAENPMFVLVVVTE